MLSNFGALILVIPVSAAALPSSLEFSKSWEGCATKLLMPNPYFEIGRIIY
jgi:hypothetical protein